MIRRRKARKPARFAEYYASCGVAKPKPASEVKAENAREERDWIGSVRSAVFDRDHVCRLCAGLRRLYGVEDEMHEIVPRSQTRGLPLHERFSLINCIRLCRECHRDVTERRVWLVPVDVDRGANGVVVAQPRKPA